MIKVFAFLAKRADLEHDAFVDYYENHHVPLVLSLAPAPDVYKRNYVVPGEGAPGTDPEHRFDVVTELAFPDRAAFAAWLERLSVDAVAEDEARFLDRTRTRSHIVTEHATTGGYDL